MDRLKGDLLQQGVIGSDVVVTIDARIQQAAADALGNSQGSIVVLDPRTGAVLALASRPSFDPNRVESDWDQLRNDQRQPLFNRSIQALYVPGSTFKTLVAAAAVDLGVVDLDHRFRCTRPITIGNLSVDCRNHSHLSEVNFSEALAWSCNRTFALTALGLGQPGPLDLSDNPQRPYPWETSGIGESVSRLREYARRFGFEQPIPFDLPVEASRLSDPGQEFFPSLLGQTGFGQGQVAATPLQMALLAATIANGGAVPRPYLVTAVRAPSGASVTIHRPGEIISRAVSAETASRVNRMMELSVETAHARLARIPNVGVGGKTGTAEVGGDRAPNAWFIGYAPSDDPRVAVAAVFEHGGSGADVATPAAQRVMSTALDLYRPER
jgi:peptidoglycan glycosyltransferase